MLFRSVRLRLAGDGDAVVPVLSCAEGQRRYDAVLRVSGTGAFPSGSDPGEGCVQAVGGVAGDISE